MSLLYTMQALDHECYESMVALARPSPKLVDFYRHEGFETIPWPGMTLWDHSTVAPRPLYRPQNWMLLWRVFRNWKQTQRRMIELIERTKPNIVHLNSMPLSPCADILAKKGFPFVWHVREPPPDQGFRTRFIRRIMLSSPQVIFIS